MSYKKKTLHVGIVFFAGVLIYSAGFFMTGVSPISAGKYELYLLASVIGIHASVPPNPYNILAQQFEERERVLLEKERNLAAEEDAFREQSTQEGKRERTLFIFLSLVIMAVIFLLTANFYFDFKHRKQ